jgi:hypothetical protein
MSQRPGKFISRAGIADEDEDGRTVVRGAPKIVKRSALAPTHAPASMSPAAVIKATLESARAAKRAGEGALMPPPPAELLEDATDRLAADDPRLALANRIAQSGPISVRPPPSSHGPMTGPPPPMHNAQGPYTAPMGMQPVGVSELGATMLAGMGSGGPHSHPPPSSHGPMTGPPPPMHGAGGYPPPSGSIPPPAQSYRPPNAYPAAAASQSGNYPGGLGGGSMPAHFMVPHGVDPPGTSVTARHRTPGRPTSAWAMALVTAGLLVGVGAVAVVQSNDSLMDTTASFVDPSRAATKPAAPAAQPAPEPVPQAAPTTAIAPAVAVPPAANAESPGALPVANNAGNPGGLIGASAPPPVAAPAPEPKPEVKPVAVAATPPPATPPKTTWIAPTPKAAPAAAAPAAAPAPKPAAQAKPAAVAVNDDPPAEKPAKPAKGAKPGKGDATDEETKRALEALQKAQLESSFDK